MSVGSQFLSHLIKEINLTKPKYISNAQPARLLLIACQDLNLAFEPFKKAWLHSISHRFILKTLIRLNHTLYFNPPYAPVSTCIFSSLSSTYSSSYGTSWENLLKHQGISALWNISFILMTCMFDQVVIL